MGTARGICAVEFSIGITLLYWLWAGRHVLPPDLTPPGLALPN